MALPVLEAFRSGDPLPAHVMEQILLGVSTRGYAQSLEPVPESIETRGTSKSAASRALVEKTSEKLAEFVSRRLDDVELVAMFTGGIEIAGKATILALGVTNDGSKVPLGLALGSTENAVVATDLLQNLVSRGLRIEQPLLCVIDGGKGIRKALADVLGDRAVVQRCQVHKMRGRRGTSAASAARVRAVVRCARRTRWRPRRRRRSNCCSSPRGSNRTETTAPPQACARGSTRRSRVLRLGLPRTLCWTFSTTNAIENMNGTIRRVVRNVKRWRGQSMVARWVALGVAHAAKKFRRVKGHTQVPTLVAALRPANAVHVDEKVA